MCWSEWSSGRAAEDCFITWRWISGSSTPFSRYVSLSRWRAVDRTSRRSVTALLEALQEALLQRGLVVLLVVVVLVVDLGLDLFDLGHLLIMPVDRHLHGVGEPDHHPTRIHHAVDILGH